MAYGWARVGNIGCSVDSYLPYYFVSTGMFVIPIDITRIDNSRGDKK